LEDYVYALVQTGGKQYRVQEGRAIKIEHIAGEPGDTVELGEVLLMSDGDDITVGAPLVAGARVLGTIAEQGRDRKIVVFKYKNKTRARKKTGHRQHFTRVRVDDILAAGQEPKPKKEHTAAAPEVAAEAAPKRGRSRKPTAAAEAPAAEAVVPETTVESAKAPAEKPKRGRKKAE